MYKSDSNYDILAQKLFSPAQRNFFIVSRCRPHTFDILVLYDRLSLGESAGIHYPAEVSGITDKYQELFSQTQKPPRDYTNFHLPQKYKTKYKQIIVPLFSSPSHDISLDSCLNCCHTLSKQQFTVLLCLCMQPNKLSGSHLKMVLHVWLWFEKCSLKGPWSRVLGFPKILAQKFAYSANRKEFETHSVEQPCLYD